MHLSMTIWTLIIALFNQNVLKWPSISRVQLPIILAIIACDKKRSTSKVAQVTNYRANRHSSFGQAFVKKFARHRALHSNIEIQMCSWSKWKRPQSKASCETHRCLKHPFKLLDNIQQPVQMFSFPEYFINQWWCTYYCISKPRDFGRNFIPIATQKGANHKSNENTTANIFSF